jgi:predicted RNA binding protein YcfA (HicA-like mRNA interferase family)
MLLKAGYELIRTNGSHRIYINGKKRVVIPFHTGKTLHPKITKDVYSAVENTSEQSSSDE